VITRSPDVSIIIPFYNRADTLPFTLESIARARKGLEVEVLLVDDGSTPPAVEQLKNCAYHPVHIIRQENQGLLFARLAGLKKAKGEYILFLDSDDLIGPDKLIAQVSAMRASHADVSYTDFGEADLCTPYDAIIPRASSAVEDTPDSATFFIRGQPPPHSPIFRTAWLTAIVDSPLFPPSALYNPVAEIWFYHIASVEPGRALKVPGLHTIVGHHPGTRLTGHWEKLAAASLAVMEAFQRACPDNEATAPVRRLVGEKAFASWRALPYNFSSEFSRRLLAIWRRSPRGELTALGGRHFCRLARLIGPRQAGWLMRRLTGRPYSASCTLSDPEQFTRWLALVPRPTDL
jgi:hypothetical protein